jgi:hypothetical protein
LGRSESAFAGIYLTEALGKSGQSFPSILWHQMHIGFYELSEIFLKIDVWEHSQPFQVSFSLESSRSIPDSDPWIRSSLRCFPISPLRKCSIPFPPFPQFCEISSTLNLASHLPTPSISMIISNGFESLHFHVFLFRKATNNFQIQFDQTLRTSNCCGKWLNQSGSTLFTEKYWNSLRLDSDLDYFLESSSATWSMWHWKRIRST